MAVTGPFSRAAAQTSASAPILTASTELPEAPQPAQSQNASGQSNSQAGLPAQADETSAKKHKPRPQPKRILGVMPNYRAVSAGVRPPPPSPREAFKIATQNSFDYSSGVFVGITSLMAEGSNAHPALGKGVPGFWGYYWRGFADKADGNYWVIWALPSVTHEDERYYARGEGSFLGRAVYASTRVLITPNYQGRNVFNASEIFGRGISQAISLTYYPSSDQNLGPFAEKYGYAVGRDALTNTFREFWPDIDAHFIHRHRQSQ